MTLQLGRAVLSLSLLAVFVSHAVAATNVQSFPEANCNPGTSTFVYASDQAGAEDIECKTPPDGTIAIWIESLDAGCTIRTFASASCSDVAGLSISPATCYIRTPSPDPVPIASWRIVCGAQDAENPVPSGLLSSTSSITSSATSFTVDATLVASSSSNSTASATILTTATTPSSNSTTHHISPTGGGGPSRNSTESATWSYTLTTSTTTTQDVSPYTASPSGNGAGGESGSPRPTGASSGRSRGKAESAMLVVGSLLGLGWGVLW